MVPAVKLRVTFTMPGAFMKIAAIHFAVAASWQLSGAAYCQTATPASAAKAAAAVPLSQNISLTSNSKFRGHGQDQTKTRAFKPGLQSGVDCPFDSSLAVPGAFAGTNKNSSYFFSVVVDTSGHSINENTLVAMLTKTL